MNETLWEVNWHYKGDTFSHCTVTPITVVRRGILPGCSAESISAVSANGEQFLGSEKDYFQTEEAAWKEACRPLLATIESNEARIVHLQDENFAMHRFLCSQPVEYLPENQDETSPD